MKKRPPANVVLIGGGQASAQAIMSLRQWGFEGALTLVGEEVFPPYQRPPLSKAYMKGELAEERLFLRHAPWYEDNRVNLVLATRATSIDRAAARVEIEHHGHIDYDALIIATGSRPRRLDVPGAGLRHVFDLRSLADVERIRPRLGKGRKIIIVGAGFIGLEAAAVASELGLKVTVLEYAPRVLERVTGPYVSDFYQREHRARGVEIRLDARLERFLGDDEISGAELDDGTVLPTDLALVGIGIVPNVELAQAAGIDCDDGIVVDRDSRSSDPAIYAAGDCTRRPLVHYGRAARLESVHNAIEQGRLAAAAILGRPRPTEDCPWFWSDQYDLKLQIAGLSEGYEETVIRGSAGERQFAVFYLADGKLLSTDAINSPPEFLMSKKLIASGAKVDAAALADASIPMKDIVASLGHK